MLQWYQTDWAEGAESFKEGGGTGLPANTIWLNQKHLKASHNLSSFPLNSMYTSC